VTLLTKEHLAWIGQSEPPVEVEVSRRDIVKYSLATEQVQERYLRGDEAPPMFIFNLFGPLLEIPKMRTDGLLKGFAGPKFPLPRVMAGGVELAFQRPIRAGDRLIGVRTITDIYEKEGSSGPLIFTVRSLKVSAADGEAILEEQQTSISR